LVTVLSAGFIAAWQNPPPLSLTASAEPAVVTSGETVTLTFIITNAGDESLEEVEVTASVPEGTEFERAAADNQQWDIDLLPGAVRYRATGPFPTDKSAELLLVVIVREEPGQSIVLDGYEASARGFESAVVGAPLTILVDETASPTVSQTPVVTQTPTATMTVVPPTGTATQTPTPEPSPSATETPPATSTPEPTPTPTITVVVAELPPTPTPNLSSEQEVVGTITVLIFVGLVTGVIVFAVVWMVRNGRSA
jgi:uncharacterized repeat protein (TIGR01451 family)